MEKILNPKKILAALILVLVMVVSIFPLANYFTNQENYEKTIVSIDDKVDTVLKLTATSTVASGAISMLPDDTATPIAAELAEFAEYFLFILCALYAEKYLLTIVGAGLFKILIPCICVLLIIGIFTERKTTHYMAMKIGAIGLAIFFVIPMSTQVSDMVYNNYRDSIQETIEESEMFSTTTVESEENGTLGTLIDKITGVAVNLSSKAAQIMNGFVESLAVMIVTACVIPILVLLFFFWLIKVLTGIDILPGWRRHSRIKEAV